MTSVELTGHLVADEKGNLFIRDKPLADVIEAVFVTTTEEHTKHFGYVRMSIERIG